MNTFAYLRSLEAATWVTPASGSTRGSLMVWLWINAATCSRMRLSTLFCLTSDIGTRSLQRLGLLDDLEGFQYIAGFQVVVVLHADAALVARFHLPGVFLETLQGGDLAGVNDHPVPHQARRGVAPHDPVGHVAAGDDADLGDLYHVAPLRGADGLLLQARGQHALHGGLDVVDDVVDDVVLADLHLLAVRQVLGGRGRAHVEAHDDGAVGGGQQHVAAVDGPRAGVQDVQADFRGAELLQGVLERLHGAVHVALDDDLQLPNFPVLDLVVQGLQGDLLDVLGLLVLFQLLAFGADLPRLLLAFGDLEGVAGVGDAGKAQDLHGDGGGGFLQLFPLVAEQGSHLPRVDAGHEGIAHPQGAPLDQGGGHDAPAEIDLGLHDPALGAGLVAGLQLQDFALQQDRVQQLLDALAFQRRNLAELGVPAPGLGDQAVLGQLLLHPLDVGLRKVDLVDRHDDRHF